MPAKRPASLNEFKEFREKMNEKITNEGTLTTRRFFTLDGKAYESGTLNTQTKELLGLVASMVLRCDDCITYHIIQSVLAGTNDQEIWETFDIALIVGGSIVVPHLRRAVARLEECRELEQTDPNKLSLEGENSPYE
ncbi:MAG: carboxymuconolactone decarboxylase family protein [Candidatus Kariarchaeaceae archaeon]|jgi:AhpD family alkylhydroperoxidase